jgi:SPP1 family predicted phage head-tail adaptor
MLAAGTFRHQADLKLPSTSVDKYGQRTGADTTVIAAIPCEIQQLTGLELIRARKIYAEATHSVKLWGDPSITITARHYLLFGARKLFVGGVVDRENTGVELELLCKEAT